MKTNIVSRLLTVLMILCTSVTSWADDPTPPDSRGFVGVALGGSYNGKNSYNETDVTDRFSYIGSDTWQLTATFNSATSFYILATNGEYSNPKWGLASGASFSKGNDLTLSEWVSEITIPEQNIGSYTITVITSGNRTVRFDEVLPVDTQNHHGLGIGGSYFGSQTWNDLLRDHKFNLTAGTATWTLSDVMFENWGKDSDHRSVYFIDGDGNKYFKSGSDGSISVGTEIDLVKADAANGTDVFAFEVTDDDEGYYDFTVVFTSADAGKVTFGNKRDLPVPVGPDSYGNNGVALKGSYFSNGNSSYADNDRRFTYLGHDTWRIRYFFDPASKDNNSREIALLTDDNRTWRTGASNIGPNTDLTFYVQDWTNLKLRDQDEGTYDITVTFSKPNEWSSVQGTVRFVPVIVTDNIGNAGLGLVGGFFGVSSWGDVSGAQKFRYDEDTNTWTITDVKIDNWRKASHDIYLITNNGDEWRQSASNAIQNGVEVTFGKQSESDAYKAIQVTDADEGVYTVTVKFIDENTAKVKFTKTADLTVSAPDYFGHENVRLIGSYINAGDYDSANAKSLTYKGRDTWSITNVALDPSTISQNNNALYFASYIQNDQWNHTIDQWTKYGSDGKIDVAPTTMAFKKGQASNNDGRYNLDVSTLVKGHYDITIQYDDDNNATVTFDLSEDGYGNTGIALGGTFFGYTTWAASSLRLNNYDAANVWEIDDVVIDPDGKASSDLNIILYTRDGKAYCASSDVNLTTTDSSDTQSVPVTRVGDNFHSFVVGEDNAGIYKITVTIPENGDGSSATVTFLRKGDLPAAPSFITYNDLDDSDNPIMKPNVVYSIDKKIDGAQTPAAYVMFGTSNVKYRDNGEFKTGGVSWNVNATNDSGNDFSDPNTLAGFAEAVTSSSTNPSTEVNGQMANSRPSDGGLFLTPVAGDFIRVEPVYNGSVSLWTRQPGGNSMYIMDQIGKVLTATETSNVETSEDGYKIQDNGKSCKYVFDVQAGKTYYVGMRNALLNFVAVDFEMGAENSANNVTIDEDAAMSSLTAGIANVKVIREFTSGWMHPIVLPFSVSESMMKQVFGNGVQVLYLDSYANSIAKNDNSEYKSVLKPAVTYDDTDDCYTIRFTKHYYQMLYAGVPAFVIPSQDVSTPLFSNVTIETDNIKGYAVDADGNFTVTGSYAPSTPNTTSPIYYISNDEVNGVHKIVLHRAKTAETDADKVNMRAMRVWIQANVSARPIKGVGFNSFTDEDEEVGTSGIVDVAATAIDRTADTKVYNMLGIPVADGTTDGLAPGIYIHQGRKVVVR